MTPGVNEIVEGGRTRNTLDHDTQRHTGDFTCDRLESTGFGRVSVRREIVLNRRLCAVAQTFPHVLPDSLVATAVSNGERATTERRQTHILRPRRCWGAKRSNVGGGKRRRKSLKNSALGVATGKRMPPYVAANSSLTRCSLLATPFLRRQSGQHNLDQSEVCSIPPAMKEEATEISRFHPEPRSLFKHPIKWKLNWPWRTAAIQSTWLLGKQVIKRPLPGIRIWDSQLMKGCSERFGSSLQCLYPETDRRPPWARWKQLLPLIMGFFFKKGRYYFLLAIFRRIAVTLN